MKAKIDWKNGQRAFEALFIQRMKDSKQSVKKVFAQQMKLVVRNILEATPPFGGKGAPVTFAQGRKRGRKAILKSLNRSFVIAKNSQGVKARVEKFAKRPAKLNPINEKYGWNGLNAAQNLSVNPEKLLEFHDKLISKDKRTIPESKRFITKEAFVWIRDKLFERQGWGAAGWIEAAKKMLVSNIPEWVLRFGIANKGRVIFNNGDQGQFYFMASNPTDFPSIVQNSVNRALYRQARNMVKQLHFYTKNVKKL